MVQSSKVPNFRFNAYMNEENMGCEVPHLIYIHATPCDSAKKNALVNRTSLSIHVFGTLIEGSLLKKGQCGMGFFGTALEPRPFRVLKNHCNNLESQFED